MAKYTKNNDGRAVGPVSPAQKRAEEANPPAKAETPAEIDPIDALQLVLDLAGMIPGAGAIPDLLNAAISLMRGDFVGALFSAGAAVPAVGDAAGAAKILKNADKYAAAIKTIETKVLPKLPASMRKKLEEYLAAIRKKIDELTKKEKPKEKAESKDDDGAKSKPKEKLKCGQDGSYGDLKKQSGDGKFDRDHIPSKAALHERAKQLNGGDDLTPAQKKAITDWGNAIAIPREAHQQYSPTYGGRNDPVADAKDLASSAKRDVDKMLDHIGEYDADGGCKKAYKKASKKITAMTNEDYAKELKKILKSK